MSRLSPCNLRIFVIQDGFAEMVSTSVDSHYVLVRVAGPRDAFGHATMADTQRN